MNADIAAAGAAAGPGGDNLGGNARRGSRDFDVSDITDINNLNLDSGRRNNQNNQNNRG